MKPRLLPLMLSALLSLFATGCASLGKLVDDIPEGSAKRIHYTRTGKFSSTTATVEGWNKTADEVAATKIEIRHSNAWMPNVAIELEDYHRPRTATPDAPVAQ